MRQLNEDMAMYMQDTLMLLWKNNDPETEVPSNK